MRKAVWTILVCALVAALASPAAGEGGGGLRALASGEPAAARADPGALAERLSQAKARYRASVKLLREERKAAIAAAKTAPGVSGPERRRRLSEAAERYRSRLRSLRAAHKDERAGLREELGRVRAARWREEGYYFDDCLNRSWEHFPARVNDWAACPPLHLSWGPYPGGGRP
ncbi:MAG: hypothetical protein WC943_04975 [Elusimicrobiota bacterium]|jgi:hypothetical protein